MNPIKLTRNVLKKTLTILEHPELLRTLGRDVHRGFAKELFFLKKNLGIVPKTILDVGAATGEYSKAARFVFPQAQVYAFEPIPRSCEELRRLATKDNYITVFELALSSRNEKTSFHYNQFSFSSSLLQMAERHTTEFPATRNETLISIECRRLDSLSEIRLTSPAFMKIDVQGAELQVLYGAESLLREFAAVTLEVNYEKFYEGQAVISEVLALMNRNGFSYFLQRDVVFSPSTKRPLFGDILFFK